MTIKPRFTEMFGIEYPIVQGGMQWVARAELLAAVSTVGGLGILSALTQPDPKSRGVETGEDDIPGLILIPTAAERVKVPIVASGGFGDARGLAAAFCLAADGISMGTSFCETVEAPNHEEVKQMLVRNTARVGESAVSKEVMRILDAGLVWAGQVQGLIHDFPTVGDLISRILEGAMAIVRCGLMPMTGLGAAL